MAIIVIRHLGANRGRVRSVRGVGPPRYPPLEGCMVQFGPTFSVANPISAPDHALGNSVGAIGWPVDFRSRAGRGASAVRPDLVDILITPFWGGV